MSANTTSQLLESTLDVTFEQLVQHFATRGLDAIACLWYELWARSKRVQRKQGRKRTKEDNLHAKVLALHSGEVCCFLLECGVMCHA